MERLKGLFELYICKSCSAKHRRRRFSASGGNYTLLSLIVHEGMNYMDAENIPLDAAAASICGKGLAIAASIWFNDVFVDLLVLLLGE